MHLCAIAYRYGSVFADVFACSDQSSRYNCEWICWICGLNQLNVQVHKVFDALPSHGVQQLEIGERMMAL
jgi:hypothetical protein